VTDFEFSLIPFFPQIKTIEKQFYFLRRRSQGTYAISLAGQTPLLQRSFLLFSLIIGQRRIVNTINHNK